MQVAIIDTIVKIRIPSRIGNRMNNASIIDIIDGFLMLPLRVCRGEQADPNGADQVRDAHWYDKMHRPRCGAFLHGGYTASPGCDVVTSGQVL